MASTEGPILGVVGATGAVGQEALVLLEERGIGADRIRAFASERSAGPRLPYGDSSVVIQATGPDSLCACDALIFASTAEVAHEHARRLAASGRWVVDNSAAFRMDPAVPLVIPELNAHQLDGPSRLVANPNCSTVLLLMAIAPLRELGEIRHLTVSTYQAVSGAGLAAIAELRTQCAAVLAGQRSVPEVFPEPCAFNVFPHESAIDPLDGNNGEEQKIVRESRRILGLPDLSIFATCVRVPIERAHSQAIVIEFDRAPALASVLSALAAAPGVRLGASGSVTPLRASGQDAVLVGRVRVDEASRRVGIWACTDQLRKGAALNAVQILERVGVLPADSDQRMTTKRPMTRSNAASEDSTE